MILDLSMQRAAQRIKGVPVKGIGVCVVDSQRCVGEGLSALIESDSGLSLLGHAVCFSTARKLIFSVKPQVVVCDLRIEGGPWPAYFSEPIFSDFGIRRVIFANCADSLLCQQALENGASGFVLKSDTWSIVRKAIFTAAQGGHPSFLRPCLFSPQFPEPVW